MRTTEYDIKKGTFDFALETLRFCNLLQEKERDFILTKQLIRSSTSIGANIRESRNAVSKRDLFISLR